MSLKKTVKSIMLATFACAVAVGCSSDFVENPEPSFPGDNFITPIDSVIYDFASKIGESKPLKISISKKASYQIDKHSHMTRAVTNSDQTESNGDLEVYSVSFEQEGRPGFAIVTEMNDSYSLFYYSNNGTLEQSREIEPLAALIDSLPERYSGSGGGGIGGGLPWTRDTTRFEHLDWYSVGPIMATEWGQNHPYNMCMELRSDGRSENGGRKVVGCGAVAVGQFLASQQSFTGPDSIVYSMHNYATSSHPQESDYPIVAAFLRTVADWLGSFPSPTSPDYQMLTYNFRVRELLTDCNYNVSYVGGDIDLDRTNAQLRNGYPLIVCGEFPDSDAAGHLWIVDGLYGETATIRFHCNWGWGGDCNGWLLGTPYTSTGPTRYSSDFHAYYIN